jgi:hypothetical protein
MCCCLCVKTRAVLPREMVLNMLLCRKVALYYYLTLSEEILYKKVAHRYTEGRRKSCFPNYTK